jgi:acetate kinase
VIILVVNTGSSSLKYTVFKGESLQAAGLIEKIGSGQAVYSRVHLQAPKQSEPVSAANHREAITLMLNKIVAEGVVGSVSDIQAVGHRVVHGGPLYKHSVRVDAAVLQNRLGRALAPLHAVNYDGMEACMQVLPGIPHVAVFDTAFHQTMPEYAATYAIPYALTEKYQIRKYGFHGTSHKYVSQRAAMLLGRDPRQCRFITLHLGNGSSIAAVDRGQCVDTSMGMTPLAGVVMGTRAGDLDPAILPFLMQHESWDAAKLEEVLNKQSGILGLSGISNDMRDILKQAGEGHARAKLAVSVFVYSIVKYIGAYWTVMGGIDALIFTAGIGEKSPAIRAAICQQLHGMGVRLHAASNQKTISTEKVISTVFSRCKVFVVPTNEELMIAKETLAVVNG